MHRPSSPFRLCVLFPAILFFFCATARAATAYYVRNGGNDSAAGTMDAPWAHCPGMSDWSGTTTLASGDTVYFRSDDTWTTTNNTGWPVTTAGVTYNGSAYGSGTRAKITTSTTGQATTIVWIAASNVTFTGFDVDGNARRTGGIYVGGTANDTDSITVNNCLIHNFTGISGDWNYGILVTPRSSSYMPRTNSRTVITNCEVYDTFHEGIAVYAAWVRHHSRNDGVLIRNNKVYKCGYNGGTPLGGGIGVLICNDSDNVTVEHNEILDNDAGIWMRISPVYEGAADVVSGPNNAVIRYNSIHDNINYGISTASSSRGYTISADIYGNVMWENGSTEISIGGDLAYTPSVFNIYNNTIYSRTGTTGDYLLYLQNYYKGASTTKINLKNNILYASNCTAVWDFTRAANFVHSNNVIYRASGGGGTTVTSISPAPVSMPQATITVTVYPSSMTFTKTNDGVDWTSYLSAWGTEVEFTGLKSSFINNMIFLVTSLTANQIITTAVTEPKVEVVATGTADSDVSGMIYIYNSGNITYYNKNAAADSSDWRTKAHVGGTVTWSGFPNANYNGTFTVSAVGSDYIGVPLVQEFNETTTVSMFKYTHPSYSGSATAGWESTALTMDPAFVNTGTLDFHLTAGSPAVNSGTNVGLTADYDGYVVPWGGAPDIGAFEYGSSGNTTDPAAPTGLTVK